MAVVAVVANDGRNDAGSPVRGRCHDPAAGRIFLVDGHCIDGQPIVHDVRLGAVRPDLGQKLDVDRAGAAAHLEAARQDTLLRQAPRYAAIHRSPYRIELRIESITMGNAFIGALHLGNAHARSTAHRQHLGRGAKGVGNTLCRLLVGKIGCAGALGSQLLRRSHETATD